MNPTATETRELAERESDGVHVLLLWHPADNALTVLVEDARAGGRVLPGSRSPLSVLSTPSTTHTPTRRELQGGTNDAAQHAHH